MCKIKLSYVVAVAMFFFLGVDGVEWTGYEAKALVGEQDFMAFVGCC
jgi:hypothetical protein